MQTTSSQVKGLEAVIANWQDDVKHNEQQKKQEVTGYAQYQEAASAGKCCSEACCWITTRRRQLSLPSVAR